MKIFYWFATISIFVSGCSLLPQDQEALYRLDQFTGGWISVSGALVGQEFTATVQDSELLFSSVADSACLPAGSVVFAGTVVADRIVGKASFCIGSAQLSSRKMVVTIKDKSTLSATIEAAAGVNFPNVVLERQIRISQRSTK
jgi:hypothetical protein